MKQDKIMLLSSGKSIIIKPQGNSMLPYIRSKQKIQISPYTWQAATKGDIVFCKVKGRYYIHFVVAKDLKRGCKIANAKGHVNGWTKQIYGKVSKILED